MKHYLSAKEKNLAKKSLHYNDDAKQLTAIKQKPETNWLNEVCAQSLQQSLKHLDGAFNSFYKKLKRFPRFKSKRGKQSFRVPQGVRVKDGNLYVIKFSEGIKMKQHRPIQGEIRNATISMNKAGQYFVSIGVRRAKPAAWKGGNNIVGIDLGIKDLAVCSDGIRYSNIKPYRNMERLLKIRAKALSRTTKGSKGREKARLYLAKLHNKIVNIRSNHLHQVSHRIVRDNQAIILEDLNVKGMMKNHKLAKSITDVSLHELVRQITYKAKWYSRSVLKIDRWFPSSKTCSCCGYINEYLTLSDREWICSRCKTHLDRDLNAAMNIQRQGLNLMNKTAGIAGLAECLGGRPVL